MKNLLRDHPTYCGDRFRGTALEQGALQQSFFRKGFSAVYIVDYGLEGRHSDFIGFFLDCGQIHLP